MNMKALHCGAREYINEQRKREGKMSIWGAFGFVALAWRKYYEGKREYERRMK